MNSLLDIYLDSYEGPLDLLIHLIQKNEMNIFEVPIAEITDHFVAEIRHMQALDMDIAAEFIYMASYLIYLKSRSMLPAEIRTGSDVPLEEESFDFTQAIIELAYCKDLSGFLKARFEKECKLLMRNSVLRLKAEKEQGNPFFLADAYFASIYREPEPKVTVDSTKEQVEATAERVKMLVISKDSTLWSELAHIFPMPFDKAVAFSSVLELAREQVVKCVQESNFTEILMKRIAHG